MKPNMGGADRIVRLFVAILIVIVFFKGIITGILGIVLLIFAAIFVVTSLIKYCPLYSLFNLNTCHNKNKK